jgi:hypothetical protein
MFRFRWKRLHTKGEMRDHAYTLFANDDGDGIYVLQVQTQDPHDSEHWSGWQDVPKEED